LLACARLALPQVLALFLLNSRPTLGHPCSVLLHLSYATACHLVLLLVAGEQEQIGYCKQVQLLPSFATSQSAQHAIDRLCSFSRH
jgi:hypothetical protein